MSYIIERIIKTSYIFNDIILTFWSYIIKASFKSDIAIVWIDIWDFQNSIKVKLLINRCFNVGQHITTIVVTTCWNSTHSMLTSAKLTEDYLVVGIIRELDKEPLLHCYPIYISYRWSMLQQCVYLISTLQWLCKTVHPALMSICPICGSNVVYIFSDIIV